MSSSPSFKDLFSDSKSKIDVSLQLFDIEKTSFHEKTEAKSLIDWQQSNRMTTLVRLRNYENNTKFQGEIYDKRMNPKWKQLNFNKKLKLEEVRFFFLFHGGPDGNRILEVDDRIVKVERTRIGKTRNCLLITFEKRGKDRKKLLTNSLYSKLGSSGLHSLGFEFLYSRDLDRFYERLRLCYEPQNKLEKKDFYNDPRTPFLKTIHRSMVMEPYTSWGRKEFHEWLKLLPVEVVFEEKKKKLVRQVKCIISIYDIFSPFNSESRKYVPNKYKDAQINKNQVILEFLDDHLFGTNNKLEESVLLEFYEKLKKPNEHFHNVIEYESEAHNVWRNIGDIFQKYINCLLYMSEGKFWTPSFNKVITKMVRNEAKMKNGEQIGIIKILNKMMKYDIWRWDLDECRDHILGLMFCGCPFISHEKQDQVLTTRFGDKFEKKIEEVGKNIIKEKNLLVRKSLKSSEEAKKKMIDLKVNDWNYICSKFYHVGDFKKDKDGNLREVEIVEQEKKYFKTLFDEEKEFLKQVLKLEIPLGMSIEEYLQAKSAFYEGSSVSLEKIDPEFKRKIREYEQIRDGFGKLLELKQKILEKVDSDRKKPKKKEINLLELNLDDLNSADLFFPDSEDIDSFVVKKLKKISIAIYGLKAILLKVGDSFNEFKFLRSQERREEIQKALEQFGKIQEKKKGVLEVGVKLVLAELPKFDQFEKKQKKKGVENLFLSFIDKCSKVKNLKKLVNDIAKFYKFGFVHASVAIKDIQFHWNTKSFVAIKQLRREDQEKEFFSCDCYAPVFGLKETIFYFIHQLSKQIILTNSLTSYKGWGISAPGNKTGKNQNCQEVTMLLLKIMKTSGNYEIISHYTDEIKKNLEDRIMKDIPFPQFRFINLRDWKWKKLKEFRHIFKDVNDEYQKKYPKYNENPERIVFVNHQAVDDYYCLLKKEEPAFNSLFPEVFELIKAFDRGFHMLRMKCSDPGIVYTEEEKEKDIYYICQTKEECSFGLSYEEYDINKKSSDENEDEGEGESV